MGAPFWVETTSMNLRRSRIVHVAVIAFSISAFIGGAQLLFDRIIDTQNNRQLDETIARILERAEISIDYAFIALGELAENGTAHCGDDALINIRRLVYERGTIKDIRVIENKGSTMCSAFPETIGFDVSRVAEIKKFSAANTRIQLFRLEQQAGAALALQWNLDPEASLVAVINTDALLFDMVPPALREKSEAFLKLGNEDVVASFLPSPDSPSQLFDPIAFSAASKRYPLVANMRVDGAVLRQWNKEVQNSPLGIGGVLGLLVGLLLVRAVARPADLVSELDDAIKAKEFRPYLQPIFSIKTSVVVGCEVLARWHRRDGLVILPGRFIPLAEESGRIVPLTRQIVIETLTALQPLMKRNKSFYVSFNVAPNHFLKPDFVDEFRGLAAAAKVSTRQIVIELTERNKLRDLELAAAVTKNLREHAFKVAIDDAGTGHSGLSYIQKLGVNIIKIDKFFIDSIDMDSTANAVVEMLVGLAHKLDLTTVAEGIETEQQLETLQACGVDEGQGYLFAPAVPVGEFLDFIKDRMAAPPSADGHHEEHGTVRAA